MTGIIAAILAAIAALSPSPHHMFAVTDNGGVLVTRQPLSVHQTVFCGGVAELVVAVHPLGSVYEVRLIPGLPASDVGRTVTCST